MSKSYLILYREIVDNQVIIGKVSVCEEIIKIGNRMKRNLDMLIIISK